MNRIFILIINIYRFFSRSLSFGKPNTCVFYPSCSEYSKIVFKKYSWYKALFLTIKRILRCHPWQKNHIDIP